jgi:large repetitive protein
MQRVVRYSLLGLLTIASLTACGDKITVPGVTTTPVPTVVHSVTVTPPSVTMNVGDKVKLTASVDADAGVTDRTVTWSSSNTAVVAVDASGNLTAVTAGNASVSAVSNADKTVSGAAAVTVGGGNPNNGAPATVTISTINQTVCSTIGGCTSVPANLANVGGQIDVTLNVDPGTQRLVGVDLVLNCTGPGNSGVDTVVATQNLSSSSQAPAANAATAPVTLSFNTATFNTTNGAALLRNGNCTLKARARTNATAGGAITTTTSTASAFTLNNADLINGTISTTKGPASDAAGLSWVGGDVTVSALPVFFTSGRTPTTVLITLSGTNPATNTQVIIGTITTTASTTGATTATFPNTANAANNVAGQTLNPLTATVTVVDNSGNQFANPLNAFSNTVPVIRLDNQAPVVTGANLPVVNFTSQNASNGFVGANFSFASTTAAFATIPAALLADNSGVDKVTLTPQFSTAAAPTTFTSFTTASSIPETSSGTAYNFRYQVCDALQNCANTAVLGTFGVDVTAPRATIVGPKNNEIDGIGIAVTNGGLVSATLTDSSGSGSSVVGSGFSATPLLVTETVIQPSGTGQASLCVIGTSTGTAPNQTCKAAALQANNFNAVTSGDGQYTLTVQAVDQAGNVSPATTIQYIVDTQAPVVSGANIAIPGTITTNTAFSSTATDNLDVSSANSRLFYSGLALNFLEPGSANPAGVAFSGTLVRSASVSSTLANFYRTLAQASGAAGAATLTAGEFPASDNLRALDEAGNLSAAQSVALPATNIGTSSATPYTIGVANTNSMQAFQVAASAATVSLTAKSSNPASTTLTGTVTAANQTTATPFTSVCFYYQNPTGTEGGLGNANNGGATGDLVLIACTTTPPADVTSPTSVRTFTYQTVWTPALKTGTYNVFAVGVNSTADGVITTSVPVTIVP